MTEIQPTSETYGQHNKRALYDLTYKIGGEILRVSIEVDPIYPQNSSARVQVFNADRKWTDLVALPSSNWWSEVSKWVTVGGRQTRTTDLPQPSKALKDLAAKLLEQGRAVLGI